MTKLPIDARLEEIVAHVRQSRALVLVAEPGAGKTTRVPPALLRAGLLAAAHPNLVMLQPRRVAARAAAERIADENGWTVGNQVGYHVRFDKKVSPHTRLRVLTEGILNRQLVDDPFAEGIGGVILDEFHERSLHTDLAIALLREIKQSVREDLILIVMSATLEAEPVAKFLGDCPVMRIEGRTYPVQIEHRGERPGAEKLPLPLRAAAAVEAVILDADAHAEIDENAQPPTATLRAAKGGESEVRGSPASGDILVFLPGVEEIRRTMHRLEPLAQRQNLLLLALHGSLPAEEQTLALRPAKRRKVILATNIAETSLTIDGVTVVIDSGLARVAGYDPRRGLDRLDLRRISKASATQRAGRAGRTAPGRCIRLWSAAEDRFLDEFQTPEIRRVDLCSTVLSLRAWGHNDPGRFGWYEPPPQAMLASAQRLLEMLGALTWADGQITPLGRSLLSLPLHPRLARLMLAANDAGLLDEGAVIAALLSEKDIVSRPPRDGGAASGGYGSAARSTSNMSESQGRSDLLIRLDLLDQAQRAKFGHHLRDLGIDPTAARQTARTRDELLRISRHLRGRIIEPVPTERGRQAGGGEAQLTSIRAGSKSGAAARKPAHVHAGLRAEDPRALPRSLGAHGNETTPRPPDTTPPAAQGDREDALLKLPLWAYPDRVARRRANDHSRAVMVGGIGLRIGEESIVKQAQFFLALDARHDDRSTKSEATVRIASAIEPQWLSQMFPHSVTRQRGVEYDAERQRVVGVIRDRYHDLILGEDFNAAVEAAPAQAALAQAVRPLAAELFAADEQAASWLARLAFLRQHMSEHPWPQMTPAALGDILAAVCAGKRSLDDIRRLPLASLLEAQLPYPLDRLFAQHAPPTIAVPSGSDIRVTYALGQPPVLAVRLQELFGWTDTPRLAAGRAPVLLHLLGPNYRPVQITDDLRSFWSTTYFQVRKDLRVRYPKHSWPEDPLTAKAEAKGRKR